VLQPNSLLSIAAFYRREAARIPKRLVLQPNSLLSIAAFYRREAAEALKARSIPAQGKHAESVRRPG